MKLRRILALTMALALLTSLALAPAATAETTLKLKTTGSVNLRKGPGMSYDIIVAVGEGKTYTYLGTSSYSAGGTLWHKISYNKSTAWVSSVYSRVYVDDDKLSNKEYVTTTGSVNLRSGIGTKYKILTTVAPGTKLFYLGKTTKDSNGRNWYRVASAKGMAWVTSKYSKLSTDVETKQIITTGDVNLRKGPGLKYDVITAIDSGVTVSYTGKTSTDSRGIKWYSVKYKTFSGWISAKYAKFK